MASKVGFRACALLALLAGTNAFGIINGTVETQLTAVGVVTDGVTGMSSAVLIDPYWVLTSAAFASICSDGVFLVGVDRAAPEASYAFAAVFPHPAYDPDTAANNLALIRLAAPVVGVTPIPCLGNGTLLQAGSAVRYVGYGATSPYDDSNTLRRTCVNQVYSLAATEFYTLYDGAGPYLGDGGGPALLDVGGAPQVAGLVSYCSLDGFGATAAARVSAYAAFIEAIMDANPPPSGVAAELPAARLLGACPNPFNPATEIAFTLEEPRDCSLTVYDLRGRALAVLADGPFAAGRHAVRWDGRSAAGRSLASGTYLVRLRAGGSTETRKVVLAK